MKSALDHLRAAVADLTASRDELDRQIHVLNRTIDELRGTRQTFGGSLPLLPPNGDAGRTVRDIVMELGGAESAFTLDQVVARAHAEGNIAKPASISSILSRMKQQGEIASVRRGVYRLQKPESPEFSGDSGTNTDTSVAADDPREEGAADDGGHRDTHSPIGD